MKLDVATLVPNLREMPALARAVEDLGVLGMDVPYPGAAAVDTILATTGDKDINAGVTNRTPGPLYGPTVGF